MTNIDFIPTSAFDSGSFPPMPANDDADWALDLVSAFRVLREIRRGVLVRRQRIPRPRDRRWLRENLDTLQEIWSLLAARGHRFTG